MKKYKELSKSELLKKFLLEFFDFSELKSIGFYDKNVKSTDYDLQAEAICLYFGYKTVYEFGADTVKARLTYSDAQRPKNEPFITEIKSIY